MGANDINVQCNASNINAYPNAHPTYHFTTQLQAHNQFVQIQRNGQDPNILSRVRAHGFEFDLKQVDRFLQCVTSNNVCSAFERMATHLDSQVNNYNTSLYCNFSFNDFIFDQCTPFYDIYCMIDFISFCWCENHSKTILDNSNNYTIKQIDNLLMKMKNYYGDAFAIHYKICQKCLQLHYNQLQINQKPQNHKCHLFANVFNLLVKYNVFCQRCANHWQTGTRKLMWDCLIQHMLHKFIYLKKIKDRGNIIININGIDNILHLYKSFGTNCWNFARLCHNYTEPTIYCKNN